MSEQRVKQQIKAVLEANNLHWSESEDCFSLRFASAIVRVRTSAWGQQTLIHIHSDVLTDVDSEHGEIVRSVNALNMRAVFGRWVYYYEDGVIGLEHDLLGDHLQEAELMTALAAVAREADRNDDLLQARFGGKKATD
jgi:hypothetical protein